MGHFHPGTITMPGRFRPNILCTTAPPRTFALPHKTQPQAQLGGNTSTRLLHVGVQNFSLLPHFQVGPGFLLLQSIDQSEDITGA